MFTATILDTQVNQYGSKDITVSYTDGTTTYQDTVKGVVDDDTLNQAIQDKIAFYTKSSQFNPTMGPVDLTPVSPIEPPTPTQNELDRTTYGSNVQILRQILAAMKVGVLPAGSDADIVATLTKDYKAEYLNLFSL